MFRHLVKFYRRHEEACDAVIGVVALAIFLGVLAFAPLIFP